MVQFAQKKMDFQRHVECFRKLLDSHHVAEFLKRDSCGALCDKYHLIIVFQFFMRAEFREQDYTVRNFFLALSLSHDLYDESKTLKHIILTYYLNRNDGVVCKKKAEFHWDKLLLFKQMRFKGFMEKRVCQKLCQLIQHKSFNRSRKELHTGIVSCSILCEKCKCPINETFTDRSETKSETPCNLEEVSVLIVEPKPKRLKVVGSDSEGSLFFPSHSSSGSSPVAFVC